MQLYFRLFHILFLALLSLPIQALAVDSIPWRTDLESAFEEAARENKLLLLHFWDDHCPPCRRLEKNVFPREDVAEAIDANFVAVKINVSDSPRLQQQYQIQSWPTDIILDANKQQVYRDISEQSPLKFIAVLEQIAAKQKNSRNLTAGSTNPATPKTTHSPVELTIDDNRQSSFRITDSSSPSETATNSKQLHPSTSLGIPTIPSPEGAPESRNQHLHFVPINSRFASEHRREVMPAKKPATVVPVNNTQPTSTQPPPLGLDGFCPVSLAGWAGKFPQWQPGDPRWGAIHRGRLYLFVGQAQQQAFLQDPDRFSPMLAGRDVVRMIKYGEKTTGERRHGVTYRDRVYLFRDEYSLQEFRKAPAFFSREALKRMPIQR